MQANPAETAVQSQSYWLCRTFVFGPGSILGATDFHLRRVRRTRALALEPCTALQLLRSDFDSLVETSPKVSLVILKILGHRPSIIAPRCAYTVHQSENMPWRC